MQTPPDLQGQPKDDECGENPGGNNEVNQSSSEPGGKKRTFHWRRNPMEMTTWRRHCEMHEKTDENGGPMRPRPKKRNKSLCTMSNQKPFEIHTRSESENMKVTYHLPILQTATVATYKKKRQLQLFCIFLLTIPNSRAACAWFRGIIGVTGAICLAKGLGRSFHGPKGWRGGGRVGDSFTKSE